MSWYSQPTRRRPALLAPGARVALVAPAGPVTAERIEAARAVCERLGFEPVPGAAAAHRTGYLAGSDEERGRDLQQALDSPGLAAVWALRGGYGVMRLLSGLRVPAARPAFIGFSDNTALHLWLDRHGLVSFHGPHAGGGFPPLTEAAFRAVLMQPLPAGVLPRSEEVTPRPLTGGVAEGPLAGGNLALLAALCGTPWQPRLAGRILFVEDVGEPPYRVDRMLRQLELSGALQRVAGLALGRFTGCAGEADEPDAAAVLEELAQRLGVPAVLDLPIGHVEENWTLPLGVRARLDADAGTLELLEPAVEEK